MSEQSPRDLEIITAIEFVDGNNRYLQTWKGRLDFKEGEIINIQGNLGISECRTGKYNIYSGMPTNQLNLRTDKKDIYYKFYIASKM